MSSKTTENKQSFNWFWIIIALIIAIVFYIASRLRIQNANEKLTSHLTGKREALSDIDLRIEYYRKEKIQLAYIKRQTTAFIRWFIAIVLLVINTAYMVHCNPDGITLQNALECIATLNAALLFLVGLFVFTIHGSFFEMRAAHHAIQTRALKFMFKKSEETIDAVLRLDLENREAVRKEITETEQAIKDNNELLNPTVATETTHSTVAIATLAESNRL